MRDFNENNITDAVLERVRGAPSPRDRQISEAIVRHLHNFVREVEPTFEEWQQAIEFLTETGKTCTENRQEFILLSDTLGVSMLVDAVNHRLPAGVTETTVLGPFYVDDPPTAELGDDVSGGAEGTPMFFEGGVKDAKGQPLVGATVDIWHSDKEGYYDVQHYDEGGGVTMRARLRTDEEGRVYFWSIVPSSYPIPEDGPVGKMLEVQDRHPYRPAHVHFMISAPGFEKLVTHVFIAGDQYIDSDVVFGVKQSLIKELEHHPAGKGPRGRVLDKPYAVLRYDFSLI